jgi:hypothetical protein
VGRTVTHRPRQVTEAMLRKAIATMSRRPPASQPRSALVAKPRDVPVIKPRRPPVLVPRNASARMVSAIDPSFPVFGTPTTVTVRQNFQAAHDEIEDLQTTKLGLDGGTMTGPIVFAPTQLVDGGTF